MSCAQSISGAKRAAVAVALLGIMFALPAAAQSPVTGTPKAESNAAGDSSAAAKADPSAVSPASKAASAKPEPEFVHKTDAEWRRILTKSQYAVTRLKDTEPPFSGRYASGHFRGTFLCVCCGNPLFSADDKFESGTGWPSFWRPVRDDAVGRAIDNSEGESRIEIMCRRCGAHLGHVFDDGPPPTFLRFCINSLALKLKPIAGTEAEPKRGSRPAAKVTAKSRTSGKSRMTSTRGASTTPPATGTPAPSSESPR